MNKKIVRRYISEIKAICPFRGRGERKYLSWFSNNVWVYCEENDIQDIDELYDNSVNQMMLSIII